MNSYLAEFIGTAVMLLLGNGVVANVVLNKTKGNNSGWIVIALGWAIAVFVGVYISSPYSGAHLNPIISIVLAVLGKFSWSLLPGYILAQLLGAMTGSFFVYVAHKQHYDATDDSNLIKATFCTEPAIRNNFYNLLSEAIATFALVIGVLFISTPQESLGTLEALPVALLVLGIGLSLGGATGYAINPARDLGPRILHSLLPLKNKTSSDWSYSWIPIVGPLLGGLIAALLFSYL